MAERIDLDKVREIYSVAASGEWFTEDGVSSVTLNTREANGEKGWLADFGWAPGQDTAAAFCAYIHGITPALITELESARHDLDDMAAMDADAMREVRRELEATREALETANVTVDALDRANVTLSGRVIDLEAALAASEAARAEAEIQASQSQWLAREISLCHKYLDEQDVLGGEPLLARIKMQNERVESYARKLIQANKIAASAKEHDDFHTQKMYEALDERDAALTAPAPREQGGNAVGSVSMDDALEQARKAASCLHALPLPDDLPSPLIERVVAARFHLDRLIAHCSTVGLQPATKEDSGNG